MSQSIRSYFPIEKGVNLAKNLAYEIADRLSAQAGFGTLWTDTFKTNAGIDAGNSTSYTYRGAVNYDVIRDASASEQEAQTTQNNSFSMDGADKSRGQSFTPSSAYVLTSVILYLKKSGLPTGNAAVKIYATADGKPTGAALATSLTTLDVSTLGAGFAEVTFNFAGLSLAAGTMYALVLEDAGGLTLGGGHVLDIGTESPGSTSDGTGLVFNGTIWSTNAADLYFKLNGSATQAVIQSIRALDLAENINSVMLFADVTLNTGAATYYVSTDDGATWTAVTPQTLAAVPAGKQIKIKIELTADAELEFWGIAA